MKQEIIADLSRITEEEQAILDGKTEVEKERYSSGQKFVMDAGKLLERGKLIDIRPHTRFIRFPAHSHNYVEMIYMCQGSTVHTINGDRIELKTGELLILNQNAVQEIEPAGRDDIAVNFLILPEFFDQTLRMIGAEENQLKDFIVGCLKSGEVPLCYLHYRIADVLPVQNLIENLVWTPAYVRRPRLQSDLFAQDVADENVFSIDIDAAHIFTDNCVFRIFVYRCKAHSLRLLYLTSFKCSFTSVSARDRRILPFWKSDTPSLICFAASAIPAFSSLSANSSSSAA